MQDTAAPVHVVFGITDVVIAIENVRGDQQVIATKPRCTASSIAFLFNARESGSFISLLPFSARLPSKEIEPKLSITPNMCPPNVNVRYLIEAFCSAKYRPHFSIDGEDEAAFLKQQRDKKKVATKVDFVKASMETLTQSGNIKIDIMVKIEPRTINNFLEIDRSFRDIERYNKIKRADIK